MKISLLSTLALCGWASAATAHFGMVLPSDTMIAPDEGRAIAVELSFGHPFTQVGLGLAERPELLVHGAGTTVDLTDKLEPLDLHGAPAYRVDVPLGRPGTYILQMTPDPYWEPAEDAYIQHLTKAYVSAYDDDSGWEDPLGLEAEILPLTRPFGLWAGNLFQGQVLRGGAPEPFAEVEVEHYNTTGQSAPSELMHIQTVRADANGVFSYVTPGPGWWGFAALGTAPYTRDHQGTAKPVELGAVLWVHFEPWQ